MTICTLLQRIETVFGVFKKLKNTTGRL